jgi:hypothetical protein
MLAIVSSVIRTPSTRWTQTTLASLERDALLRALTPVQRAQLEEHQHVWVAGTGVLWMHPDGDLRRARFTHGTHFRTKRGEFYIDSEGNAQELTKQGPGALQGVA